MDELREREHWTADQFRAFQEEQLGKVLAAAWRSSYYRQVFSEAGVKENMEPYEALRLLPLLSKATLRLRGKDMLTASSPPRGTMIFKSSGTTGTPTEIYFTGRFHQQVQAFFEARIRNWAGVHCRSRRVMFGVRKVCRYDQVKPPFWRYSPVENLAYLSIYHLSEDIMPSYVGFLNHYRPDVVMGYPSALTTLAKFALRKELSLAPAKAIITTSETVTEESRKAMERAWSCKVFDNYSAIEACVLASQCKEGRYHVSSDFGIIEILRKGGTPCTPGEVGEVICTGLHNTLQPLLRYQIGDAAAWSQESNCSCGSPLPIIAGIEGRIEDMCYTASGRSVLRFDTVFKGIESIKEGQIVQKDLDHFVVNVVPDVGFNDQHRTKIIANLALHVGNVRAEVILVPRIPRTEAGKFRAVICAMPEERRAQIRPSCG